MTFAPFPATACWQHRGARSGFEVAYFQAGPGDWRIEGHRAAHLDGCLDVDLESSALTNTLPVHPYARLPGNAGQQHYRYAAPAFAFTCTLVYDESGLVLDYPGIAVRAR